MIVAAEVRKLRTTRTPWILVAAAQLLVVAGISGVMVDRDDVAAAETQRAAVSHIGLVSLLALVLGILAVAGEYRHRTITDAYLGTPRRARVLLAKLGVYTVAGAVLGIAAAVTALAASWIWLSARGASLAVSSTALWETIAGGVLWNAAFAAIGVGVGALITHVSGAVAAALAWVALAEGIVAPLIGDLRNWLPFALGSALDALPTAADGPPQWLAGLALAGYAVVFSAAAIVTTVRRDVT
jgi:ABC-2 type transport system permease protein